MTKPKTLRRKPKKYTAKAKKIVPTALDPVQRPDPAGPLFPVGSDPSPELIRDRLFLSPGQENYADLLAHHYHAQELHRPVYLGVLATLLKLQTPIVAAVRSKILAAALARKDSQLVTDLLASRSTYDVPEVLRALVLLDTNRRIDAAIAKYNRAVAAGQKMSVVKLGQLKSDIASLLAAGPTIGRLNSSTAKLIRSLWIGSMTKNELEFSLLHTKGDNWRAICDLVHPRPDDFVIPWFLASLYGADPPATSLVAQIKKAPGGLSAKMIRNLIKFHGVSFAQLRTSCPTLDNNVRALIANKEPLETVIWYYDQLACPEVDEVLAKRLAAAGPGDAINVGFPKLLELLMRSRDAKSSSRSLWGGSKRPSWYKSLMTVANAKLQAMELALDGPVLVHGDASSSMTSAVRAASITGGIITALSDADLVFFNSRVIQAPLKPTDVDGILTVADRVKASGTTANAAGLYEAYKEKKAYRSIVTLTDEQENTSVDGFRFVDLYAKYREEVSPDCKLVIVSFLPSATATGPITRALDTRGLEYVQFKMNVSSPDFNKLDDMLASLGTSSTSFGGLAGQLAQAATTHRLATLIKLRPELLTGTDSALFQESDSGAENRSVSSGSSRKSIADLHYGPAVEAMVDAAVSGQSHGDVVVAASRVRMVAQHAGMADAVLLAKELVSTLVDSGRDNTTGGLTGEATGLVVVEGEKWLAMAMDSQFPEAAAPAAAAGSVDDTGSHVLLPSTGKSVNSNKSSSLTSRLGSVWSAAGAKLRSIGGGTDGTRSEKSGWSLV